MSHALKALRYRVASALQPDDIGTRVATADGLRSLLIFYAPPSIANGRHDDDYAAGVYARYDDVVFGTGLEDPENAYYASTRSIISKVAAISPTTVIWGYIDAGVTTGNIPLATLRTQIDQWIAVGAKGIFCDVIGYAYAVSRERQNAIIDYIHSKGVGAILNVYDPDETLGGQVDATYNPDGTPTAADSRDVLLLESWVCNSDAYPSPYYTAFSDVKTRADKAVAYRDASGIRLFGSNIILHTGQSQATLDQYRGMCEALARVFRLDGSGIAAGTYSSTGGDVGVISPRHALLDPAPVRYGAPYILNGTWTEVEAPDLGITVHFETGTHTWAQS